MRHVDLSVVIEGGLGDPPLVRGEDLRQLVGDGQVELVEGAALEEGAGALKRLEIIKRVDVEKVLVSVRIWEIVSGDVCQRG